MSYLLIAWGVLVVPNLSRADETNTFIKQRYPNATLTSLHEDAEKKEGVYQLTSEAGDLFIVAYGRGKSRSGYYPILLTTTPNGKIISVELPEYPHKFGWKAAEESFLKQYEGKTAKTISYGQTIHGVTGATATAKTTAEKVRELLKLIKTKK